MGVRKNLDSKMHVQGHFVSLVIATFDKISYQPFIAIMFLSCTVSDMIYCRFFNDVT